MGEQVSQESVNPEQLVSKYIELREKKSAFKKSADERLALFDSALDTIEQMLKGVLNNNNAQNMTTASGTFFRALKESVTVANRETYLDWALRNKQTDCLDIRAAKTNVLAYKKATTTPERPGGELPPGINYVAFEEVQVRKK